jgi:hypothetical protein
MTGLPVHLVRVTTDDREHQLWVAACPEAKAIEMVLTAIPEGWTASLVSTKLKAMEVEGLNLKSGQVRELTLDHRLSSPMTDFTALSDETLIRAYEDMDQ